MSDEDRLEAPPVNDQQDEKVRENRLRRMADRRGYTMSKSRRRDTGALDYGAWTLTRGEISGPSGTLPMQTVTLHTLDAIEGFLDPNWRPDDSKGDR